MLNTSSSSRNLKDIPTLLPSNIDWSLWFLNQHPVDLELGCGRTHFLFDRALNYPERNIVGVEWKYEFMEQAQRRILRESITNVKVFHGNAWLLVPLLFRTQSIAQVFINFPDPWWKTRHKKRLLLNDVFLTVLHERMRNDGAIILQTDVEETFLHYKNLITKHHGLYFDERTDAEQIIASNNAQSHREKKCLGQGMTIYRGQFLKNSYSS